MTAAPVASGASSSKTEIPWYIWCAVAAVTSVIIGGHWDISWHSSIGRDTFWTPAHMAIYLCGVLAGVSFGYIILSTTFLKNAPLAGSSVHIWGFRAPLGAFVASWGGITMLTSAPFDNWWHDAYGLDVKIVSPPHVLLFIGIYGVLLGTLVLIAEHMNRATGKDKQLSGWIFLYVAGIVLVLAMIIFMEYTERSALHTALPYILTAVVTPIPLVIGSRATQIRFAATFVAGVYTLIVIGFILILPLFPAQPKLGPVYQHVTQFIPPEFPMLFIVPALALDLLWPSIKSWNRWKTALVSAIVYVGLLLGVEWPFADFLMTPAARNRFFGTMYLWYGQPPATYTAHYQFFPRASALDFWIGIMFAVLLSTITIRWSLSRGDWFGTVKR